MIFLISHSAVLLFVHLEQHHIVFSLDILELAVFKAVSAKPFLAPWVELKYSNTDNPSFFKIRYNWRFYNFS